MNATCFAYGTTGSGKTYTILGDLNTHGGEKGISELVVEYLFGKVGREKECVVKMSYLEIYNEQVKDLLGDCLDPLIIMEDPIKGVMVPGLSEYTVDSPKTLISHIQQGNNRRTTGETSANQFSSRSHAILQLSLERRRSAAHTFSKLSLIDLAGSERAARAHSRGLRHVEGARINCSLLALGECIKVLSDRRKVGAFVPYRNSKLTRLLKESLGGNTKTVMVACVSPVLSCYEETINTLKYAERAKKIKKEVFRNVRKVEESIDYYKGVVEKLREDISLLKGQLRNKASCAEVKAGIKSIEDDIDKDCSNPKKISDHLLSKYEEYCEIKQSLQELERIEESNKELTKNLKESIKQLQSTDSAKKAQLEVEQNRLKELNKNIEVNGRMKKSIEASLTENIAEQNRLRNMVEKLGEAQKKDIIELQIAIRTLRLKNMDLEMQNMEMKKCAYMTEIERARYKEEIENMNKQLQEMKLKLKQKNNLTSLNKTSSGVFRKLKTPQENSKKLCIHLEDLILKSRVEKRVTPVAVHNRRMGPEYELSKLSPKKGGESPVENCAISRASSVKKQGTKLSNTKKALVRCIATFGGKQHANIKLKKRSESIMQQDASTKEPVVVKTSLTKRPTSRKPNKPNASISYRDSKKLNNFVAAPNKIQQLRNERKLAHNHGNDLRPIQKKFTTVYSIALRQNKREDRLKICNAIEAHKQCIRNYTGAPLISLVKEATNQREEIIAARGHREKLRANHLRRRSKEAPYVHKLVNSSSGVKLTQEIDELIKTQKANLVASLEGSKEKQEIARLVFPGDVDEAKGEDSVNESLVQ
eukprot:TRINITY_DN9691_c0_g3_i2.p1 TRINITY_DN9691_c0_g3~~TRINITY_DN9691_c0_g3_i2.p1  ORF type:complete len:818 (-),score=217.45 TRINITY_DN9691_c0_g3_i2:41-2494(-)